MKKFRFGLTIVLCCAFCNVFSQNKSLKFANSQFEKLAYPQAVRSYEGYLSTKDANVENRKLAITNLAFSYRKLQDFKNAERVYHDLVTSYPDDIDSHQILYYAQALASNGKFRESQKYYSIYGQKQKDDLRGQKFTVAYMDRSSFYEDSSLYKINYLYPLNTKYSDFSPMYYKEGLVFVSARKEGKGIKRVFAQNETPFLDLFMLTDTSALSYYKNLREPEYQAGLGSSGKGANGKAIESEGSDAQIVEFSKAINSKYHEGPVSFFKDNNHLIFTRNNYINGKVRKNDKGINMLKLYFASKVKDKWGDITELPFTNDLFSTGHPALSPDNRKLYFVSDMPGGFGGTDIYAVDYLDGVWGSPINLGREINTEGNEMFPFMDDLGNLYFASDGHPGLGALDIFYIEFRNGIPTGEARNLGAPINSNKDDFGLITNADMSDGYFSSNRKRGYSDDNIYSFVKGCKQLGMKILDAETSEPIEDAEIRLIKNGVNRKFYLTNQEGLADFCLETGADFEVKIIKDGYEMKSITYGTMSSSLSKGQKVTVNLDKTKKQLVKGRIMSEVNNEPIAGATVTLENEQDGSFQTVITGPDGRYSFMPDKLGKYKVTAVKENYAFNSDEIKGHTKNAPIEKNFGMIGVGDTYKIDNIYYDFAKYNINAAAKNELDTKLLTVLRKFPEIKVEIGSHTDSRASAEYNQKLSDNRAREVVKYLTKRGIAASRLIFKGYGESKLVNGCSDGVKCTEAEHQQNRRTEFRIIAIQDVANR